jgi:hypothetical protein
VALSGSRFDGHSVVLGRYRHPPAHDAAVDPQHQLVDSRSLDADQGTILYYTHQNVAELWNAMTRPLPRNGFGLTAADAEREVQAIEAGMTLLPDSEAVYREWRRIVARLGVLGVQVYDARLAPPWSCIE